MISFENENQMDLSHWDSIRTLSLKETSLLMVGVDPAGDDDKSTKNSKSIVFQRAISEAVQRANLYAWTHARKIDRLLLQAKENEKEINLLRSIDDIWLKSDASENYLPSIEIRQSVREVNADPLHVPILLAIDPWYTATIRGVDFIDWLSKARVKSNYAFKEYQEIIVTDRLNNWDSNQNRIAKKEKEKQQESKGDVEKYSNEKSASLESAEKFAEDINAKNIPLSTRERNTLLSLIAVLCKEANIDYARCAKSALIIKDLTVEMGLSIGESTIESHLKRIPEAIEARMK